MFYACSNFQNTTSQSVSVLVKALGGMKMVPCCQKLRSVGRPERVFNFSELLTRHEAKYGRPGEMNHSQDKRKMKIIQMIAFVFGRLFIFEAFNEGYFQV